MALWKTPQHSHCVEEVYWDFFLEHLLLQQMSGQMENAGSMSCPSWCKERTFLCCHVWWVSAQGLLLLHSGCKAQSRQWLPAAAWEPLWERGRGVRRQSWHTR